MRCLGHIPLHSEVATATERLVLAAGELSVSLFRYESGVAAVRLRNSRGELVVLPWLGQIVWSARFNGVDLAMASGFDMPRPAATIAGTYGCLLFHSGLLRNGVPAAEDDHAPHGEFPTAPLQRAWLDIMEAPGGLAVRLGGQYDHVVGFGPSYRAEPTVTLGEAAMVFDVALTLRNRSGKPMDLMYMVHANFAFVPGGRIVQAAPFSPAATAVRTMVPAHVRPTPEFLRRTEALAADPARMERLDDPALYDPEQVFYLRGLGTDTEGMTAMMLQSPSGEGFTVRWRPAEFPHCVRWLFHDPDQQVAAFALPSTCEPEGYAAERRKGHVRELAPGDTIRFALTMGYLDAAAAAQEAAWISGLAAQGET